MQPVKTAQEHQRADEVKVQMNKCGALSIFVGTGRGDQRGNGGADVLAHDDGNRRRIGDGTGGGEGLQNTHRSGGRLQHSRQHGTGQHAQNRVFEAQNRSMNQGSSARGLMAVDMVFIPAIRTEKPTMILPTPLRRSLSLPSI